MDKQRLQELAGNQRVYLPMRWYDFLLALVVANLASGFIMQGMTYTGDSWTAPFVYGLIGGSLINAWLKDYCPWRRKQEIKKL